tara:strand:+ start:2314 stop:3120 length:807 start_codon:yes stop_codon:yes gene_type:complete
MSQMVFPGHREALIAASVATLQLYEPDDGYYGCFSGGKDSVVLKAVTELAEVGVTWHYNVTTIDPPELVYFIREHHPDVKWERPKRNFFTAVVAKGFPTRVARWCCEEFKESKSPKGARLLMGIRAAESARRRNQWQTFTYHRRTKEYAVLPILHWRDDDVWWFIQEHGLPYCSLYDEGFKRLGCVGCPMARDGDRDFRRWPGYAKLWRRAFQRLWERRAGTKQRNGKEWFGSAKFDTWEELFEWWKSDERLPQKSKDEECDGMKLWT